jgi:hypothetical protein
LTQKPRGDDAYDDVIEEFPMTPHEFDQALAPWLTRKDRRRFWRAVNDADLIVFHG